jgi:hypothetical protein
MQVEDAMATLIKKTGSRIGRWFKEFREKNRRPTAGMGTDVRLG